MTFVSSFGAPAKVTISPGKTRGPCSRADAMSKETFYTVLGVAENAAPPDIKSAYRSLLKKIHPDTVCTLSQETRHHAEEATRELNEAYSVLSDAGQRAQYDCFLAEERKTTGATRSMTSGQASATNSPTSNRMASEGEVISEKRRRRRRRRSHAKRRSSRRERVKNLFHPVSAADWLVLFGYVLLAVAVLVIVFFLLSSAPNLQSENRLLMKLGDFAVVRT